MMRTPRALLLLCLAFIVAPSHAGAEAVVAQLMARDLPEIQGKEGVMLLVEYPPGATDQAHRHTAHAFLYVLEGSIVMQLQGLAAVTLSPGQTYYEGPDDVHIVGRNASSTQPARFVVFFVRNRGAPILELVR